MRGIPRLLGAIAALVLLTPTPAFAHDTLLSSSPEDEQRLGSSPREIVLNFSGEVMDVSTAVVVLDSAAETVDTTEPLVEGTDVSVEPSGELADGGYAVRWRVVSSDGHPISGTFTFHVGEGGPPPPSLDAAPAEEPDEDEEVAGEAGEPAIANGLPRGALLALIGALVGLVLYAGALRVRRTNGQERRPATQHTPEETETR
ncbi:copper resistance CopC family protein [Nocardiopsis sp. JB363]|uniref:copper resistance CopC family protein n=1 Tax=Nocardiopsis sp. JB363 TaxID=1434837 RepID=UPI00097B9A6D|nr:copper resistance CopC family protein [Nocardiopsis sp. JB363]SIO89838.1 Copper resistance protein CopC [Nocardiopsis sp. JB363]